MQRFGCGIYRTLLASGITEACPVCSVEAVDRDGNGQSLRVSRQYYTTAHITSEMCADHVRVGGGGTPTPSWRWQRRGHFDRQRRRTAASASKRHHFCLHETVPCHQANLQTCTDFDSLAGKPLIGMLKLILCKCSNVPLLVR